MKHKSALAATAASTVPGPTSAKRDQLTVGDPAGAERDMAVEDMAGESPCTCVRLSWVNLGSIETSNDLQPDRHGFQNSPPRYESRLAVLMAWSVAHASSGHASICSRCDSGWRPCEHVSRAARRRNGWPSGEGVVNQRRPIHAQHQGHCLNRRAERPTLEPFEPAGGSLDSDASRSRHTGI